MRDASLPVTLIVVGLAWLAWQFGWFPDVDWIIVIGLCVGGLAIMVFDGLTKSLVVAGPLLIGAGVAYGVHLQYRVYWVVLAPCLLVLLGVLMLAARHPRFPDRRAREPEP
jgi:hypothetical protein